MPLYSPIPFPTVTAVKTSTYAILITDGTVLVDGTSAFTATLPTAVGYPGKTIIIKRVDQTLANAVTIATTSSQTIDGVTTRKLMTQNEEYTVQSDGSNWQVLSHTYPSGWIAYTPVLSWTGGVNTPVGFWRRTGDSMEIDVYFTASGAVTSASLTIALPTGVTIATAKLSASTGNQQHLGILRGLDQSAGAAFGGYIIYNATTSFIAQYTDVTQASAANSMQTVNQGAPMTFAANDSIQIFSVAVPITNWEA